MRETVAAELGKTKAVIDALAADAALHGAVADVAAVCVAALRRGNKLLFAGNGGSAADAQHLAGELVNRFMYDRPGLPALALTTDSSILTAIGNDYGYEHVFARQVEALGTKGDVFVGLSTSGHSPNVLGALAAARRGGLVTVGLSGRSGGEMGPRCDHLLRVPADLTPNIQEGHIAIGHVLCALIERALFPRSDGP